MHLVGVVVECEGHDDALIEVPLRATARVVRDYAVQQLDLDPSLPWEAAIDAGGGTAAAAAGTHDDGLNEDTWIDWNAHPRVRLSISAVSVHLHRLREEHCIMVADAAALSAAVRALNWPAVRLLCMPDVLTGAVSAGEVLTDELHAMLLNPVHAGTMTGGAPFRGLASDTRPRGSGYLDEAVCVEMVACGADVGLRTAVPGELESTYRGGRQRGDCTVLMHAAMRGLCALTATLLENDADVHARRADGTDALMYAAAAGHADVCAALLRAGADSSAERYNGATALLLACEGGHTGAACTLLAAGAPPNAVQRTLQLTPLLCAAREGARDAVRALLRGGARVDATDFDGCTALMRAAERGHVGVVDALIPAGCADVHGRDRDGATPLIRAAAGGHASVCALLLDAGAGVNDVDRGCTTALRAAAAAGHGDVVDVLLRYNAHVDVAPIEDRATPLAAAAARGHAGICRRLLHARADVNAGTSARASPLMLAEREGHAECVEILLSSGAAPTPAMVAAAAAEERQRTHRGVCKRLCCVQ